MENEDAVNKRIGKNIAAFRKGANLTQAELAQKINYSDKSVSKWESGNGAPDVYVLMSLAELFGVTVNDLVGESAVARSSATATRVIVMLLSSALIWLIATVVFVAFQFFASPGAWWISFVYAVPANAVLIIVLSAAFKQRATNFIAVTVLIWGVITSVFLTAFVVSRANGTGGGELWLIFLLGIPLQAANTLWYCLRKVRSKQQKPKKKHGKAEEETGAFAAQNEREARSEG
ncbi:MAG: helix-turn-helix domain-containing protein [Candidatus Scatosoma sp.]